MSFSDVLSYKDTTFYVVKLLFLYLKYIPFLSWTGEDILGKDFKYMST
jgi:hypothetical protein